MDNLGVEDYIHGQLMEGNKVVGETKTESLIIRLINKLKGESNEKDKK